MKTLLISERQKALNYIGILLDVAREAFLILDNSLQVISANGVFYRTFRVAKKETEGKFVYNLGNKQWNIPKLRSLLESILPKKKVIVDFEVEHIFPIIGRRTMLLNARQLDSIQLIILAFEDITAKREVEKKALEYTNNLRLTWTNGRKN